jgi:hypothetical protein
MNKQAESAIRKMATDLPPSTKSGFVRLMFPAIQDARKAGHTIKAVWECLRSHNPSLGYKEFCIYIKRIQKTATRRQTAPVVEKKPESETGKNRRGNFDPLTNLKRVEATRPGFYYQGTEDLEELIHGRKEHHGKQKR